MPESDRSLVLRARGGDAAAFAALLGRHEAGLRGVCARMLSDRAAAADVVQEATLVAWLQLDRLREPDRFGPWLRGIGRMLSLRALRAGGHEVPAAELPEVQIDERETPGARVLAAERAAELAAAIGSLPDGQRDAVVLFHVAGLPQAEVAARLGTEVGAIRTRLHKARATLRERLAPDSKEHEMVEAQIRDVVRTPAGRHVVILSAGENELPIWIGRPEAAALVAETHDVERPRPHTHALALSLLDACGRRAASVRINRLTGSIFYAEVVLDDGTAVDARPSDALVLAAATGAPIEIDRAVLEAAAAGPPDEFAGDLAAAAPGGAQLLAEELRAEIAAISP